MNEFEVLYKFKKEYPIDEKEGYVGINGYQITIFPLVEKEFNVPSEFEGYPVKVGNYIPGIHYGKLN